MVEMQWPLEGSAEAWMSAGKYAGLSFHPALYCPTSAPPLLNPSGNQWTRDNFQRKGRVRTNEHTVDTPR